VYDLLMRKIILLGLILSVFSLTGCAFSDPRITGTPETSAFDDVFSANATASAIELQSAWAAVAGLAKLNPDQEKWSTIADTLHGLWVVVTGPDPVNRIPAMTQDIGEASTFVDDKAALTEVEAAVTLAYEAHLVRAKTSQGLEALLWGSIAASLAQINQGLTGAYGAPILANSAVTVTITDEDSALSDLIVSYDEAVFALRTSLGFLSSSRVTQVAKIATTWEREMESLLAIAAEREVIPETTAIYSLPPGRDDKAGMALLASSQQSIVESAATWVACAEDPSVGVDILVSAATITSAQGIGIAQWPGFPDGS